VDVHTIVICAGILNVLFAGAAFVSLHAAREKQLKKALQRVVVTEAELKRPRSRFDR
jgi:hypothetical protein